MFINWSDRENKQYNDVVPAVVVRAAVLVLA